MFQKVIDKMKGEQAPAKAPNLDEIMQAPLEAEDEMGDDKEGGLMTALSAQGYSPTPEQIAQIKSILEKGPGNMSNMPGGEDTGHSEPDGDEAI